MGETGSDCGNNRFPKRATTPGLAPRGRNAGAFGGHLFMDHAGLMAYFPTQTRLAHSPLRPMQGGNVRCAS